MIREATTDDIPALIDMGMRFHAGSAYSRLLEPSKPVVAETLRGLIGADTGVAFVDDQDGQIIGAILGIIVPHFITGEPICGELSWWVDENYRGLTGPRLLKTLEEWAKANNAKKMSVIEPLGSPRVGQLYERLGYQMVEKSYMKAL